MLDELVYDGLYSIVRRYCGGEIFEISNNSKCIIINDLNQPSAKKYVAQYNALMSEIKKITDDGMTALFVSRHIDSVTDFNTAYRECISAKRMRVFYGEDSMRFPCCARNAPRRIWMSLTGALRLYVIFLL